MHVNPYLGFKGDCEEAFKFYEQLLGGKIETMSTFAGTPMEKHVPEEWRKKIVHAHMTVGEQVLMGSDAFPDHYQKPAGVSVCLGVGDLQDAERIFKALAESGTVQMPFQKTYWAEGFGMLVDRFGTPWMVIHDPAA